MFLYGITYLLVFPSSAAAASEPRESRHAAATSAKNIARKSFMATFLFQKKIISVYSRAPFRRKPTMLSSSESASSRCSWRSPRKIESDCGDRPSAASTTNTTTITVRGGGRGGRGRVCTLFLFLFSYLLFSPFFALTLNIVSRREKATGARREEEEGDKRGGKKTLSVIFFLSLSPSRRPTPSLLFRQGKERGWRGNRHAGCGIRQWSRTRKMPRQEGKGRTKKKN